MVWCARSGPDHIEFLEPWVQKCPDRVYVTNRRYAPDRKSCLRADQRRICFAQRFAGKRCGFACIHLIAARCNEQNGLAAVVPCKDDRFRDLVDLTANRCGRIGCGSGLGGFHDIR